MGKSIEVHVCDRVGGDHRSVALLLVSLLQPLLILPPSHIGQPGEKFPSFAMVLELLLLSRCGQLCVTASS